MTRAPTVVRTEAVMGTVVTLTVRPGLSGADAVGAGLDTATRLLRSADEMFSTWRSASPVSRLRRGELSLGDIPAEVREVLELCGRGHGRPGRRPPPGGARLKSPGRLVDLIAA